ncbi:MAG TPA: hypothetical protein ENJ38_08015 [Rhodospirillales bacterium]|nr:hypothetical protein [Rhodospirillales bacterium]
MRRLSSLLYLLLAGCVAATPADGVFAKYPGLERAIRKAYEDYAIERNGMCVNPVMQTITRSKVIRDDPEMLVVEVRYAWTSPTDNAGSGGSVCNGFATRRFLFARQGKVFQLVDITGQRRTKPYFTVGTSPGGTKLRIRIPAFLEGLVPGPAALPKR